MSAMSTMPATLVAAAFLILATTACANVTIDTSNLYVFSAKSVTAFNSMPAQRSQP